MSNASISGCEAALAMIVAGNFCGEKVRAFLEVVEMLAFFYNLDSVKISAIEKLGIILVFPGFGDRIRICARMLAKLPRSYCNLRLSAVAVFLPLMP